jgi:imidazolonepropionase-like amidohydrolase
VVVGGRVAAVRPRSGTAGDLPVLAGAVVGPALVDAHVHLGLGGPDALRRTLAGGVVAVRDLGAPLAAALAWRASAAPAVAVAGPLLTAPGGYPTRSWGAGGYGRGLSDPAAARAAVRELAAAGVDVVKLALEPAAGPVPDPATARAVVDEAHRAGLAVTCHALRAGAVAAALDAGVDELCHVPVEPLPTALLARLADTGVPVVSTLRTHALGRGPGAPVLAVAAALVAAGVPLRYGTDLGNEGTAPGADPGELELLAGAGLGARGALAAATTGAARAPGLAGRVDGTLRAGGPAALVLLDGDPREELTVLARPRAVVHGSTVVA